MKIGDYSFGRRYDEQGNLVYPPEAPGSPDGSFTSIDEFVLEATDSKKQPLVLNQTAGNRFYSRVPDIDSLDEAKYGMLIDTSVDVWALGVMLFELLASLLFSSNYEEQRKQQDDCSVELAKACHSSTPEPEHHGSRRALCESLAILEPSDKESWLLQLLNSLGDRPYSDKNAPKTLSRLHNSCSTIRSFIATVEELLRYDSLKQIGRAHV